MAELRWAKLDLDTEVAGGSGCVYVVTSDSTVGVLLTRYEEPDLGRTGSMASVAAQAARNAVRLGRAADPDTAAAHANRARRLAQEFEDGSALIGQSAWR